MEKSFAHIFKLFDPYDRKARLAPALLALVPVLVLLVARYGKEVTVGSAIMSVLVSCGVLFFLARVARNAGKSVQDRMWKSWGGTPTIGYLRHADSRIDKITKDRYHSVLAKGIGRSFPSAEQEAADPSVADQYYQSGTRWLIEQTRDPKKYAHLLKENIAYGFHRNLLGLRPVGILLASAVLAAALFWSGIVDFDTPYAHVERISSLNFQQMAALLFAAASLAAWCVCVTESSVERASAAYSERLLQACEGMSKSGRTRTAAAKATKVEA